MMMSSGEEPLLVVYLRVSVSFTDYTDRPWVPSLELVLELLE